jgi:hypothetical protein
MKIMASVAPAVRLSSRVVLAVCFVAVLSAGVITMIVAALR